MIRGARLLLLVFLLFGSAVVRAEPEEPDRSGVLHGRAIDAQGAPVAGVVVEARPAAPSVVRGLAYRPRLPVVDVERAWSPPPGRFAPVAVATADPEGQWRIDGLDPALWHELRVRPQERRTSDTVLRYPGHEWRPVTLHVRDELTRNVVVQDARGRPLHGAVLTVLRPQRRGRYTRTRIPLEDLRTDRDGRGRLGGLHAGRLPFEAFASGVGMVEGWIDVPGSGVHVIAIGDCEGAVVHGTVRDVDDVPIGGAEVTVASRPGRIAEEDPVTALVATTDEAGAWKVEGLPPGRLVGVSVRAHGFVGIDDVDARRAVGRGARLRVDTVLAPAGSVEGRVVGPEGEPIAGARVEVGDLGTTTDEKGTWRLEDLRPGAWEIRVWARGLTAVPLSRGGDSVGAGGTWVQVRPERVARAPDLRLVPGARIEGTVVDEAGAPVPDAWVQAWSWEAGRRWNEVSIRTDVVSRTLSDGTFVLAGLLPGPGWHLSARTATRGSDSPTGVDVRGDGRPMRTVVVVEPLACLGGRVVDLEGRPVPHMGVQIQGVYRRSATTDAEGRFLFEGLSAGFYEIEPTYEQRRHKAKPFEMVELAPGQEVRTVEFRLDPPRTIGGAVVDEHGDPVAGLLVELKADEPSVFSDRWSTEEVWWNWDARTDEAGRFRIPNVPPGGYWIRPRPLDGVGYVEAGAQDVRLVWYRDRLPDVDGDEVDRFNRGAFEGERIPLEGRVFGSDALPVAGGVVHVKVNSKGGYRTYPAPIRFGWFHTTVPSDAHTIDVEVVRVEDASGRFLDVAPAKRTDLDVHAGRIELRLESRECEYAPIAGHVVDEEDRPLAGVMVCAGTGDRPSWRAATNADGAFRFARLAAGTHELSVDPGGPWAAARLQAPAGTADVLLRVVRARWISGRVLDVAGPPLPGVRVSAGKERARTSFDGSFRIGPVHAPVDVEAEQSRVLPIGSREYADAKTAQVAPGTVDLEIRMREVARITGVVLGSDGRRVPDARILLEPDPPGDGRPAVKGKQDWHEDGFELRGLVPGRWRLTASDEHGRRRSAPLLVTAPARGVRVVVEDEPILRGRLAGEGVDGFRVALARNGAEEPEVVVVRTDANGAFAWENGDEGPFWIHACRAGDDRYALLEAVPARTSLGDIALHTGVRIEGRLEGLGTPLSPTAVAVWARGALGYTVPAHVAEDGRFTVRGLPPDTIWDLEARAADESGIRRGLVRGIASGAAHVVLTVH